MSTMPLSLAVRISRAEALLEANDRLRHRQLHERILVRFLQHLSLRLLQRMIRRLERQPDDGQADQRISGNVHPFPEAARSQQHGSGLLAEAASQLAPVAAVDALAQHLDACA